VSCPVDKVVTGNPLAVGIISSSPDDYPGPLGGFEVIIGDSIPHESGHSSPPV
jgi:hypothetical protein